MPDPNDTTRRIPWPDGRDPGQAQWGAEAEVSDALGEGVGTARLDRYMLLDRLGEGMSAAVYRAFDPKLGRDVAIKLLQNRAGSAPSEQAELSVRMLREARAIATLAHPNVVTVHDVGMYRPEELRAQNVEVEEALHAGGVFVVMEVVDGVELRRWCHAERRHWREVLDVFLAAGEGLAAAHDAGLVHRDFKPANVLLGSDGRVRVLDFGLVRWTRSNGSISGPLTSSRSGPRAAISGDQPADAELTMEGSVMGTPAYMAPEQHKGALADTRADIFAFCVAFWEALHGTRPFVGGSYDELAESKRSGRIIDPPRSRRVPTWLRRTVEWGLAADPDRRPQSMRALLHELRQTPKRRRRIWVSVAGVAVIGAVLTVVGLRDRARADAACGEAGESMVGVWEPQTRQMLERAFVDSGAPNGAEVASLVGASLDAYAESWLSARRQTCMDTVGAGAESVDVLGRRLGCLDLRREQMRQLVGLFLAPDAKVVQRAGDAVSNLPPPSNCVSDDVLGQLADDVTIEEITSEATTLASAGLFESALSAAKEAVTVAQRSGNEAAESHALIVLAGVQMELGRYEPAESSLHAAQVAAERAGRGDLVTRSQVLLVGLVGFRLGRHEEAARLAEQVEARLLRHARDRNMPEHRRVELEGELAYGTSLLLVAQGRYAEARDSFHRLLGLRKQALGEDHPRVARAMAALGTVTNTMGEYAEGLRYLREALAMYERHLGASHAEVGVTLLNVANNLRLQARTDEALVEVSRAKALWTRTGGEKTIRYAQTLQLEASILADLGRFDEAEAGFAAATEVFEELEVPAHAWAVVTEELGFLRLRQGRAAEAETVFVSFLSTVEGAMGEGHPTTLDGLVGLGIARVDQGDTKGAKEVLARAREIQDRAGTLETDGARIDFALARAIAREDPERSRQLAERARDVYRTHPDVYGDAPRIDVFLASLAGER